LPNPKPPKPPGPPNLGGGPPGVPPGGVGPPPPGGPKPGGPKPKPPLPGRLLSSDFFCSAVNSLASLASTSFCMSASCFFCASVSFSWSCKNFGNISPGCGGAKGPKPPGCAHTPPALANNNSPLRVCKRLYIHHPFQVFRAQKGARLMKCL